MLLQVCQLFSALVVHAVRGQHDSRQTSSLENEYQIMLRKYIRSMSIQTCRIGIIGTVSLIEQLAAAAETGDDAFQQRCISSATEILDHAVNACKASSDQPASVFALLCDELASIVAKVSISSWRCCQHGLLNQICCRSPVLQASSIGGVRRDMWAVPCWSTCAALPLMSFRRCCATS